MDNANLPAERTSPSPNSRPKPGSNRRPPVSVELKTRTPCSSASSRRGAVPRMPATPSHHLRSNIGIASRSSSRQDAYCARHIAPRTWLGRSWIVRSPDLHPTKPLYTVYHRWNPPGSSRSFLTWPAPALGGEKPAGIARPREEELLHLHHAHDLTPSCSSPETMPELPVRHHRSFVSLSSSVGVPRLSGGVTCTDGTTTLS
jgi:hypothetical protein